MAQRTRRLPLNAGKARRVREATAEGDACQHRLTRVPASTTVDQVSEKVPDPNNPAQALAAVTSLRRLADRLEAASVQAAVDQGWNWVQIADALGVTKQAVHKKYARRVQRRAD